MTYVTIWVVACVHAYVGVCLLVMDPAPRPFSTLEWIAEHGGLDLWALAMLASAAGAVASLYVRRIMLSALMVLPSQAILIVTACSMAAASVTTFDNRIILGGAYLLPLVVFHTLEIWRFHVRNLIGARLNGG